MLGKDSIPWMMVLFLFGDRIILLPMGSGEVTPDKPIKMGVRWSKTSGLYDGGTVDEAGTSNPSRDERMPEEDGEDALAFPNSSTIIQSVPRHIFVSFGSKYG